MKLVRKFQQSGGGPARSRRSALLPAERKRRVRVARLLDRVWMRVLYRRKDRREVVQRIFDLVWRSRALKLRQRQGFFVASFCGSTCQQSLDGVSVARAGAGLLPTTQHQPRQAPGLDRIVGHCEVRQLQPCKRHRQLTSAQEPVITRSRDGWSVAESVSSEIRSFEAVQPLGGTTSNSRPKPASTRLVPI